MTMRSISILALSLLIAPCVGGSAHAACTLTAAEQVRVLDPVRVWPGAPPAPQGWPAQTGPAVTEGASADGRYVFNVTDPSYRAYLPAAGCATGAAVVIAPGGGFRLLSVQYEGEDVARWLASCGVAAFVLRYRLYPNPGQMMKRPPDLMIADEILGAPGVADGIQALADIRAGAAQYGIDPARIGAIGFSAGAHVVSMMAITAPVGARPAFVGSIYGGPFTRVMPPMPAPTAADALPPVFLAMAQDDRLAGLAVTNFAAALTQAGYTPELHYYLKGGHGFAMKPLGSTTDHFIEEFHWWMQALGVTQ
ncbi:MAG: alpha/beta hydrolase [Azospirillaceae bacterium]|nr:alpha/beta hydrolase [Azospirillaceae bacterium]